MAQLSKEWSEIMIYNWVFCFSKPLGRGACRVKYGRSADSLWAVQSLCPRSGPRRMDFDDSLIVLGKHPHGVRLQTKTAIPSSSFCREKCSQGWQITAGHEVPGLTMASKTWWDRSDPKGYINLSRNEHWITRHHFFLIFPLPASPLSILHKKDWRSESQQHRINPAGFSCWAIHKNDTIYDVPVSFQ